MAFPGFCSFVWKPVGCCISPPALFLALSRNTLLSIHLTAIQQEGCVGRWCWSRETILQLQHSWSLMNYWQKGTSVAQLKLASARHKILQLKVNGAKQGRWISSGNINWWEEATSLSPHHPQALCIRQSWNNEYVLQGVCYKPTYKVHSQELLEGGFMGAVTHSWHTVFCRLQLGWMPPL